MLNMLCIAFTMLVGHRRIVYFVVSVAKVQYFFEMGKKIAYTFEQKYTCSFSYVVCK